ncbi:MAG: hypothetical protein IKS35_01250 [Clostridia bacterium]|nr:hypothetical protein [Clostridia bacterium]
MSDNEMLVLLTDIRDALHALVGSVATTAAALHALEVRLDQIQTSTDDSAKNIAALSVSAELGFQNISQQMESVSSLMSADIVPALSSLANIDDITEAVDNVNDSLHELMDSM